MPRLTTLTFRMAILAMAQAAFMACCPPTPAAHAAAPMASQIASQGKTVIQPSSPEPATETRAFALRSGGSLRVSNVNGSIKISAWDKNEVALTADFKPSSDGDHVRLKVDSADGSLELIAKHPKNRIRLSGSRMGASCDMELKVPHQIANNINSVNGTIQISGTSGKNRVNTVNGGIALENVNGNITVSTVNGSISGSIQNVEDILNVSSVNGSINLKLLKPNGALRASWVNGSMNLQTPGANNVEVTKRRAKATFSNGGASMVLSTVNGSIVVQ